MSLIINQTVMAFDLTKIKCGDLLWGRHRTWTEGKAGFVTSVTEGRLAVQYFPGIGNVTNHFFIPALEVAEGQWEIRCSSDLLHIEEYRLGTDAGSQEEKEDERNLTGRTDL